MKIKNIMFTGFMAAILGASGAVAADTPVSVASTGYVDSVVEKNVTEVSFADDNTTYLKEATGLKGAALALDKQVDLNAQAIAVLDGGTTGGVQGLVSKIDANADAVERLDGGAEVENSVLNKITTAIGGLTGTVTGDTGVVKTISQADGVITATRAEIVDADIAANAEIEQSKIKGLTTDLAAKANVDDVYSKEVADTTFVKPQTTLAGYGITDAYTQEQVNTKLDEKQNKLTAENFVAGGNASVTIAEDGKITISATDTTYTGTGNVSINDQNQISVTTGVVAVDATTLVTGGDVAGYAVPKPGTDCSETTCVLSINKEGNPYWMKLMLAE